MGQHHLKVHLALFAVSFIYALTFSLVKDIMPYYLQGFGFIVIRVSGAAILFLLAGSQVKERIDWRKHGWRILACAVFGVAANMLMFFKGLEITSPINGAVLMLATPIFVLLLNLLINKERMNILQAIGILMAALGSVLLMSGKSFGFSSATYVGDLLILFNAISYAIKRIPHANRFKVYLFNWCAIGFAFWVFRAHARQIFRNANEHSLRSLIHYCVHHFCNLSLECMGHQTSWSEHRWRLHIFTTNPCNDYCSDFKERYFKHL